MAFAFSFPFIYRRTPVQRAPYDKGMKDWYGNKHAHHNADFAKAVVMASVSGRKKFRFMKNTYVTADFTANVADDLRRGCYRLKVE